jgi:hypothetical protein
MPGPKTKKKRRLSLPEHVVAYVWARAAGRCEFLGCNVPVWKDVLTTKRANVGKLAHIVAASPDGPRGDPIESPCLARDPSNIMLACGTHHDLIDDKKHETAYPKELLRDYKRLHYERIERLTGICEIKKSVPILVQIPVGAYTLTTTPMEVSDAVAAADHYPDDTNAIVIDLNGMSGRDHDAQFWAEAQGRLSSELESRLAALGHRGPVGHVSLFAFGPIPLLVFLGHQLDEKLNVTVYNRHRPPVGWAWPKDAQPLSGFHVAEPVQCERRAEVALVLSVTSQVQRQPIADYLSPTLPIFEVSWPNPRLDSVKSPDDLSEFVTVCRDAMERIHRLEAKRVHLFSAVPVAAAVEFGRLLQKKLHPPIMLHDFHAGSGGWRPAFELASRTKNLPMRRAVEFQQA